MFVPRAVVSDQFHSQIFPVVELPFGFDGSLGLGRLDSALKAGNQVLNPVTINLTWDRRLPLGFVGVSVLVLGRMSHPVGHGFSEFYEYGSVLVWLPSWAGLDCSFFLDLAAARAQLGLSFLINIQWVLERSGVAPVLGRLGLQFPSWLCGSSSSDLYGLVAAPTWFSLVS